MKSYFLALPVENALSFAKSSVIAACDEVDRVIVKVGLTVKHCAIVHMKVPWSKIVDVSITLPDREGCGKCGLRVKSYLLAFAATR